MKRNLWIGLGAVGILLAGGAAYVATRPSDEIKWRQTKVERGHVTQRINATGTINALISVPVGTQVSGVVTGLYADYNSLVKKGQVIARIDPTVWETQLKDAEATLQRSQATFDNARTEYSRYKRLSAQKLVSDSDLDAKEMTLKTAQGSLNSAKAALAKAKINLGYCTITAPVDGVVVSRLVDAGQTVAASYSTPNLFTIAQDLSKMKVEASIDEADIGSVVVGQRAFFTVDSFPDRQFSGSVSEVHLEATTTSNVVTYKVVMEVTNEPRTQSADSQKGGQGHGQRAAQGGPDKGGQTRGTPDFDAMWQRMKDRLPAGTTKEAFIAHVKARMAEGGEGAHHGRGGARPAEGARSTTSPSSTARYIAPGSPVYGGEFALLPGMTANVTITTNSHHDVLRVPNAALRFNPNAFQKDEKKAETPRAGGLMGGMMPPPGGGQRQNQGASKASGMAARREDKIWVLENGKPKAVKVTAGISDGQFTEVSGEGLKEGMQILVGVEGSKPSANGGASSGNGTGGGRR